ncbi:hypothetical protein HETIRDRAFT_115641 [Heterobasidion irregulare TC 32-1]|uniref:Histone chaperone domain-containing protein n=1 Tax=Heterobasidion irregulare (strain TC 32-1) TaxID=747525 RepID=W4K8L5_HETIT|nr:uncharacterized protein HETIRDRAFT_115641 [Heterobasidion irregulare TC 32-1]ETW82094.1 hypothetical protein HETIRDRAFT_115641 [Heterobasidion irregulare TC 32-1]
MSVPNIEEICKCAHDIVIKARKARTLSALTPRLIRESVEKSLSLEPGALDEKRYKKALKGAIEDAKSEDLPEQDTESDQGSTPDKKRARKATEEDKEAKRTPSSKKSMKDRESSPKKAFKSKEIIEDSDDNEDPAPPSPKKPRKGRKRSVSHLFFNLIPAEYHLQNDADDKPPKTQTAKSRKQPVVDEDAEAGPSKTDPTSSVPSSSTRVAANDPDDSDKADQASSRTKSESELSVLIDDSPKPRSRKRKSVTKKPKQKRSKTSSQTLSKDEQAVARLKSIVVACGARKIWSKEFSGLDKPSQQVARLRSILSDLGMIGRPSLEQAKAIKEKRELAKELADVQQFGQAVAAGKPFQTRFGRSRAKAEDDEEAKEKQTEEESEAEVPTKNAARRSIMAFLGDQSDDDD